MIFIGFSTDSVKWFEYNLWNQKFSRSLGNFFADIASILCGVPQGSILGPLLFLIYVNDMLMAVKCNLSLYADDIGLVF